MAIKNSSVSHSLNNVTLSGNYSQNVQGILTNSPYTTTTTIPNYTTGTLYAPQSDAYVPKIVITDCPLTYDSNHSDGNTYQHEVAAIQVTRNDEGEIIKSKMIKVFWVETRSQGSIDYAASKDPAVSEFEPNDIIIKTLRTIRL
jgi:hypothetical protein